MSSVAAPLLLVQNQPWINTRRPFDPGEEPRGGPLMVISGLSNCASVCAGLNGDQVIAEFVWRFLLRTPGLLWRRAPRASSVRKHGDLVLRVRLVSGDSMDVTYEDRDAGSEDEVIDHIVSTLADDSGVLRCRHGDRLLVLYARGVAAVEVRPRGAVL